MHDRREFINGFEVHPRSNRRDVILGRMYLNDWELICLEAPVLPIEDFISCLSSRHWYYFSNVVKEWRVENLNDLGDQIEEFVGLQLVAGNWYLEIIKEFMALQHFKLLDIHDITSEIHSVANRVLFSKVAKENLIAEAKEKTEKAVNFIWQLKEYIYGNYEVEIRESILSVLREYQGSKLTEDLELEVPIRNVELEDVNLGDFLITLDLSNLDLIITGGTIDLDGLHHPHVSTNGYVCFGEARSQYLMYLITYDFLGAIETVESILRNYNPNSPYESISEFANAEAYQCNDCGATIEYGDSSCYDQENDHHYCNDCIIQCQLCNTIYPPYQEEELAECTCCNTKACTNCLVLCSKCGSPVCENDCERSFVCDNCRKD